ncbi:unnamed protein product [Caenorhabditis bovis]|uniref:C-type lectin domain-containing protein n=1 Tax=Caenorhabditis bovis TaxID=2654633 RepID=A0A8S1ECT9_9PELO|nr:unnamed protein product [Caenorhabditis bovis]
MFVFLVLSFLIAFGKSSDFPECDNLIFGTASTLTKIGNKCIFYTSKQFAVKQATPQCRGISKSAPEPLSIDSEGENSEIRVNPPIPISTLPPAPPTTLRTTLPPSEQRRSTAVVIAVDASIYSTSELSIAQINFANELTRHIQDRGPSEFAYFLYGCTKLPSNQWINQYPPFISSFEDTKNAILTLNETYISNCLRTNPLDFNSMFSNMENVYYNRYTFSPRKFKSDYISMIFFSASTNATNIKSTSSMLSMPRSSVITVNVGDKSIDISGLAIPKYSNGLRVNNSTEIENLVGKIDEMIFGYTSTGNDLVLKLDVEQVNESEDSEVLAASFADCAFFNDHQNSDKWYSGEACSTTRTILCQYVIPTPAPPPPVNPTISWADPCVADWNFTYYEQLNNAKCYRPSSDKKSFYDAENECLTDHPTFLHSPKLTSIQSRSEEEKIIGLFDKYPNEGMFWIGLRRDPHNSTAWYFINGDSYDGYTNWYKGYPREADGCDCVAYVINLDGWINTDCNKNMFAMCAYRFNSTTS